MDSSAFNRRIPPVYKWIPWSIVATLVACIFVVAAMTAIFESMEPSAISLPTKDFICTESAIVDGVAECVEYRRKEK